MRTLILLPCEDRNPSVRMIRDLIPENKLQTIHWLGDLEWEEHDIKERMSRFIDFDPFMSTGWINSTLYLLKLENYSRELGYELLVKRIAQSLIIAIRALNPSAVWVLGHMEHVPVLKETFEHIDCHLHISVHDEPVSYARRKTHWPHCRLRAVERAWPELLRRAQTVDSISVGMQGFLRDQYNVDSTVLMKCPRLPVSLTLPPTFEGTLHLGMSGWCDELNLQALLLGLHAAIKQNILRCAEIIWVGSEPLTLRVPPLIKLTRLGWLSEETDVVATFETCHALYLPYPFSEEFAIFRQTSFPSKLPTYLSASRQILFHAPEDSTPILFAREQALGRTWTTCDQGDFCSLLPNLLRHLHDSHTFTLHNKIFQQKFNITSNRLKLWGMLERCDNQLIL